MNLNLILQLAIKDIKLRYSSSRFGYFWMIANPVLMLVSLSIIFTMVMKLNFEYYQVFLLLGFIVWNFFVEATSSSVSALIASMNTLKRIKIPLHIIVLGSNLSALISFASNLFVLMLLMVYFKIPFLTFLRLTSLVYFGLLLILVTSISLLLCTIYLYFRDIVHIWSYVLFIGFWLTPIIYPLDYIPQNLIRYYMLNPLTRIISHLRNAIIYNYVDPVEQVVITFLIIAAVVYICLKIYLRFSNRLGEVL